MTLIRTLNETATMIVGARGSAVETARGRVIFMGVLFALAFLGVGARVTWLCLLQEGAEPRFESLRAGGDGAAVVVPHAAGAAGWLGRLRRGVAGR